MRQKSGKYFEVVVQYDKVFEDGLVKTTKDVVVVEAVTCADAERRALEEIAPLCAGEADCVKVALATYKEIFFADEGDIFYKSRVVIITMDEYTNKEKRTNIYYLTNATSIEEARKNIVAAYANSVQDYVIASLSETKVIDVYEKK